MHKINQQFKKYSFSLTKFSHQILIQYTCHVYLKKSQIFVPTIRYFLRAITEKTMEVGILTYTNQDQDSNDFYTTFSSLRPAINISCT